MHPQRKTPVNLQQSHQKQKTNANFWGNLSKADKQTRVYARTPKRGLCFKRSQQVTGLQADRAINFTEMSDHGKVTNEFMQQRQQY